MKKSIQIFLLVLFTSFLINAQTVGVEKLTTSSEIKLVMKEGLSGIGPATIAVDEVEQYVIVSEYISNRAMKFIFANNNLLDNNISYPPTDAVTVCKIGEYEIGSSETFFQIRKNGKQIALLRDPSDYAYGISFVLRNNSGYSVFIVNEAGAIRAIDTNGKLHSEKKALDILKEIDPEKFEQSRIRAQELGLEEKFLLGKALVWGNTYYDTPGKLNSFWGKVLYGREEAQVQYDSEGNGYQINFSTSSPRDGAVRGATVRCVDTNGNILMKEEFSSLSKIIPVYQRGRIFTTSTYVGFGGNIYFYVAGDEFTELFRIRRTWDDPDMYAMAINGYTKDAYGQYVDTVLEKMSKDDLRLLRNHVFALYGYVFKDAALNGYFDKLVWYLAKPEVNLAGLNLPEERKALVDRVLEEEKKR